MAATAALALGACESSDDRDRERRLAEATEYDRMYREMAPPIALRDAVGCNVCPDHCRHLDLHKIPLSQLLAEFRQHARKAYRTGRPSLGIADEFNRLMCIALRFGPAGERAMLDLLDDEDPAVRLAVAWQVLHLGLAHKKPISILRSEFRHPRFGYVNQMRVRIWYKELDGTIRVPGHRRHPPTWR